MKYQILLPIAMNVSAYIHFVYTVSSPFYSMNTEHSMLQGLTLVG